MTAPVVGVVVVNFNGGDLTLDCLRSLTLTEWPAPALRVVLVDNASTDGVAARVRDELPVVRVIESPVNTGFAGGCNVGIRALGDTVEHVALLNNDATVDPAWLTPLVDALEADPALGAACPKILFAGRFRELTIHTPTQRRRGDHRDLGIRVSGARIGAVDVWSQTQLVRGFWGAEPSPDGAVPAGEWTTADAMLRLPALEGDRSGSSAALRLSALEPVAARVTSGGRSADVQVQPAATWVEIPLDGEAWMVINNAGTVVRPDGYGADRGYLERDDGRFDTAEDVVAWCGGGVLLRRAYLDDVGLFDERLFLYYEDLELSWRGREKGWRYRFVPGSVVRHVHAATTGEGSPLKDYYNERNRLLVLTRHGTAGAATRASLHHLAVTASYAWRDVVGPVLRGEAPHGGLVGRRLRAFGGFLRRAPAIRRRGSGAGAGAE